mmetsp:Transcript_30660/g.64646  ORF Transcript_30660/g.64646 Transcript_30660/m.64646 type:complete len:243 (-) Transcript_30660:248-976(-)
MTVACGIGAVPKAGGIIGIFADSRWTPALGTLVDLFPFFASLPLETDLRGFFRPVIPGPFFPEDFPVGAVVTPTESAIGATPDEVVESSICRLGALALLIPPPLAAAFFTPPEITGVDLGPPGNSPEGESATTPPLCLVKDLDSAFAARFFAVCFFSVSFFSTCEISAAAASPFNLISFVLLEITSASFFITTFCNTNKVNASFLTPSYKSIDRFVAMGSTGTPSSFNMASICFKVCLFNPT